jgi:hypothetical protein
MKSRLTILSLILALLSSCGENGKKCNDKNCKSGLACKLTSKEMLGRKATVIASLQKQMVEKKELDKGYSFKFKSGDAINEELKEFIKTEKECCEFFDFKTTTTDDKNFVWLDITGPDGAKEFITTELGL